MANERKQPRRTAAAKNATRALARAFDSAVRAGEEARRAHEAMLRLARERQQKGRSGVSRE